MRPSRPLRSLLALGALALTLGLLPSQVRPAHAAEELAPTDASASPPPHASFPNGGDFGGYLVERYGGLVVPNALHGQSGSVRGSGLEARYMMPVGWGAYFRYARAVQTSAMTVGNDTYAWDQWDLTFGFSKRLQATPQRGAFRQQTRLDLGVAYSQAGTNMSCQGGAADTMLPWSLSCSAGTSGVGHGLNSSGTALGLEARLSVELAVGPIGLGLDFGGAAFKSLTSGSNSDALPSLFFAWSAQARAGLSWTIE